MEAPKFSAVVELLALASAGQVRPAGLRRHTGAASMAPVSLELVGLLDDRQPAFVADPAELDPTNRPYGVAPTLTIWALWLDASALDAGVYDQPQLSEDAYLIDVADFLANGWEWLVSTNEDAAAQLSRTVRAMVRDLAALTGDIGDHITRVHMNCRNCGWRVVETSYGWECPACGDEVLLNDELAKAAATYTQQEFTLEEAAEETGVPYPTLRRWMSNGRLTACGKRGRAHLLDRESVDRIRELAAV